MKKKTDAIETVKIPFDYIANSDCIEGMKAFPDNCVDLIIADPPYNLSKSGDWKWDNSVSLAGMGGNWNITNENWDNMSLDDYLNFSMAWLVEAKRILKTTGSMWIFGTYHNIGIINIVCQMLNIEIINEVIWYKKNAFPNLSGRRLTASHETMLLVHSVGKKRNYYFDYEYSKNGEFPGDELKSPGKQMRTVWDLSNNKNREELKYGKHPTQKPIKILTRMIKLTTKPGDVMLTPFAGAGSECVAAKKTGRHYIGFEIEKEYCDISEERLLHTEQENEQINLFQMQKGDEKDDKPSD